MQRFIRPRVLGLFTLISAISSLSACYRERSPRAEDRHERKEEKHEEREEEHHEH